MSKWCFLKLYKTRWKHLASKFCFCYLKQFFKHCFFSERATRQAPKFLCIASTMFKFRWIITYCYLCDEEVMLVCIVSCNFKIYWISVCSLGILCFFFMSQFHVIFTTAHRCRGCFVNMFELWFFVVWKQGSSGGGEGFEVTKYGHGRVALIGFPRFAFFMTWICMQSFYNTQLWKSNNRPTFCFMVFSKSLAAFLFLSLSVTYIHIHTGIF